MWNKTAFCIGLPDALKGRRAVFRHSAEHLFRSDPEQHGRARKGRQRAMSLIRPEHLRDRAEKDL
jgi:hypothetical protein